MNSRELWVSRARRCLRLAPQDRPLLLLAAALAPCAALGLRILGFKGCKDYVEHLFLPAPLIPRPCGTGLARAQTIALLVFWTERTGLGRANCLERSLVLWWLLRYCGIGADLRIGARRDQAQLQAHAWVEFEGHVLNDHSAVPAEFATLEQASRALHWHSPAAN